MDFAVLKKIPSDRHYENIEFRTIVDKKLGIKIRESRPIFSPSPAFSQRESIRINFEEEESQAYHSDGGILPMRTLPRFKTKTPTGRYYYFEEHREFPGEFLKPQCDVKGLPREKAQPSAFRLHTRLRARPSSPPLCTFCKEREKRRVAHAATQTEPIEPSKGAALKKVFHWPFHRKRGNEQRKREE